MYQAWLVAFVVSVYYVNCTQMGRKQMLMYLNKYGYLSLEDMKNENATSIEMAVREFQHFANINDTGQMDDETEMMMSMPRCGMKDKTNFEQNKRIKRYVLHDYKWDLKTLTYSILSSPNTLKKYEVEDEIRRAFSLWSDHSDVTFQEREFNADIKIRFILDNDLNGPGDTLAYASYPNPYFKWWKCYVHFDLSEQWTIGTRRGINLLQVAAHEFGHSLGLEHSNVDQAVMSPFYSGYIRNFKLGSDDIQGIQELYGKKFSPNVEDAKLCNRNAIDTIFTSSNGQVYVFKGSNYWTLNLSTSIGKSKRISMDWPRLPENINAAFRYNGKTYFFKGNQYWRYTGFKLDWKFPKYIYEGFPGVPNNIDAVLARNGHGKIYFFKGSKYWQLDANKVGTILTPKPMSNWRGVPIDLSAAFEYNFETYFIKDDVYYKFNHKTRTVEIPVHPRSIRYVFFGCKNAFNGPANKWSNKFGFTLVNSSGQINSIPIIYYVSLCMYVLTIFNKYRL